jgi:hypothetical protein
MQLFGYKASPEELEDFEIESHWNEYTHTL